MKWDESPRLPHYVGETIKTTKNYPPTKGLTMSARSIRQRKLKEYITPECAEEHRAFLQKIQFDPSDLEGSLARIAETPMSATLLAAFDAINALCTPDVVFAALCDSPALPEGFAEFKSGFVAVIVARQQK